MKTLQTDIYIFEESNRHTCWPWTDAQVKGDTQQVCFLFVFGGETEKKIRPTSQKI